MIDGAHGNESLSGYVKLMHSKHGSPKVCHTRGVCGGGAGDTCANLGCSC